MQAHRLCHERVEVAEELVDRVVGRVIGDDLSQRLTENLGHLSLQISAYAQTLVDELIGAQAGVLDDVIVIAVVNDIHVGRLLGVQQHCAGCTAETVTTSEVAHSRVMSRWASLFSCIRATSAPRIHRAKSTIVGEKFPIYEGARI